MRSLTIATLLALTALAGCADDGLLEAARGWPETETVVLPCAHDAEAAFTLPEHAGPVQLYLEAILKFRALSRSAGVLRLFVNDAPLGPEHSVNKAGEWCSASSGPYAANAFALPAQPDFAAGEREDLGGLGYLFDISDLVRAGENRLRITHVAAADVALLRRVYLVIAGEPQPLALSEPAVAQNDPTKLQWNFAPNIMEGKGLFLAAGCLQPLSWRVRNVDRVGAVELGLELELPPGVEIVTPWLPYADGWTDRITVASEQAEREGVRVMRHTIRLPGEAAVGPETDWGTFGGHPLILYLRCNAPAGEQRMWWRSLSQGGEGEEMSAPLTVLPAPPDAPPPQRSPLGVWAYRTVSTASSAAEQDLRRQLQEAIDAQLARLGVSRLVLSDPDEIPAARSHDILVSLASPWSYDRTVYPSDTTDPAKALLDPQGNPVLADRRTGAMQWCPTYAAEHGPEVFGPITQRIADEGWDGFDLDHEGVHHQCFCERCRTAFLEREGLAANAVAWPEDVLPEGRLHERWLAFHVWNGGRHVERIREAVKAGNPDALLFCWFTMSLYERDASGPHADLYRERVREEAEYGYDLREFLRHFDFANMANGVYPHDEETWDYAYGLNWAFNRVEATVDNEWDVPLAPCLNIGSGAERSWTNFDYLRWQAKTHLAQGVKGLDFWMLPFFDGRHYTLLSELGRILAATEDIVWDGEHADELIAVEGPDGIFARVFANDDAVMLGITNRALEPATVRLRPAAGLRDGREVLTDEPAGASITVRALDGVFVIYAR
ncbi:MAG: hypothetical protein AB7Y46_03280 [Armatimonadota bacterium]